MFGMISRGVELVQEAFVIGNMEATAVLSDGHTGSFDNAAGHGVVSTAGLQVRSVSGTVYSKKHHARKAELAKVKGEEQRGGRRGFELKSSPLEGSEITQPALGVTARLQVPGVPALGQGTVFFPGAISS